jgi:hypothetical protein
MRAANWKAGILQAGWVMAAGIISVCVLVIPPAGTAQSAQGGSLADAARQARAQKQSQSGVSSAQQVADELSEDQNDDAPGGFKTYNAGDYKLWVPAPYKVEGHDDAGTVLGGPMIGVKHPVVLVGTPIAAHFGSNDDAFQETAMQFSHLYSQTATCSKATVGGLAAYQCGLAAANLQGQHVSGNAVFVLSAGNVYPVFCVTPTDSRARDVVNNAHASVGAKAISRDTLSKEDDDARSVWQKCDTVFQSIRVRPGVKQEVKQQVAQQPAGPTAPAAAAKSVSQSGAAAPAATVAAGATHQDATPAAQTPPASSSDATTASMPAGSTVPAGFKVYAFNYCKSRNECWNASVLVPADAKLVSSGCKQYIFTSTVQGAEFLLMAGPANGECDGNGGPDPVRWNQLVDPETKRAPGTYNLISSQNTSLAGKPAIIVTMSFRRGLDSWMGKRGEVENNGVPLVVGCMALRDHFADGDGVCSTLIGSLLLP